MIALAFSIELVFISDECPLKTKKRKTLSERFNRVCLQKEIL